MCFSECTERKKGTNWANLAHFLIFLDFFSYIIEGSVCYLCICDRSYPRKLAFSYLEELGKEFNVSYGNEVDKPGLRPYAFVKFGTISLFFFCFSK